MIGSPYNICLQDLEKPCHLYYSTDKILGPLQKTTYDFKPHWNEWWVLLTKHSSPLFLQYHNFHICSLFSKSKKDTREQDHQFHTHCLAFYEKPSTGSNNYKEILKPSPYQHISLTHRWFMNMLCNKHFYILKVKTLWYIFHKSGFNNKGILQSCTD